MVLASNIIAIFLQALCIKLGSVTGMNLAENIREHCPPWLNYVLYFLAESAIIATDIAEVSLLYQGRQTSFADSLGDWDRYCSQSTPAHSTSRWLCHIHC